MQGRVLIIAGSDPSGGAGIQADIKTVTALKGYAAAAIAALTAQNTEGVKAVLDVPAAFVAQQVELVLTDIGADIIKTGMLNSADVIKAIAPVIRKYAPDAGLIIDPVMVSKSGHTLLQDDAIDALKKLLIPHALVVTPNIPEAEILTGMKIKHAEHMIEAGHKILAMGAKHVVMKGGHLEGNQLIDILVSPEGEESFSTKRMQTRNTHGTGCTLASAIATCLAKGMPLRESVMCARAYVKNAIRSAPNFGKGNGPLNHCVA